jgi:hypothetical protein
MHMKTRALLGLGASAVVAATALGPSWDDAPAGRSSQPVCGEPSVDYPSEDSMLVSYDECDLSADELRLVWCSDSIGRYLPANVVIRVAGAKKAWCYR